MYKMSQIFAVFVAEKDEKETKRVQSLLVSRLSNALLGRSANLADSLKRDAALADPTFCIWELNIRSTTKLYRFFFL
jgi:hypothetical protein